MSSKTKYASCIKERTTQTFFWENGPNLTIQNEKENTLFITLKIADDQDIKGILTVSVRQATINLSIIEVTLKLIPSVVPWKDVSIIFTTTEQCSDDVLLFNLDFSDKLNKFVTKDPLGIFNANKVCCIQNRMSISYVHVSFLNDAKKNTLNTNAVLRKGECSDFTITVIDESNENSKKVFKVHKFILKQMSPVFERMFNTDMAEQVTNNINLKEYQSEVVDAFIDYIYFESCSLTESTVHGLFQLSHLYEVKKLTSLCKLYIMSNIDNLDVIETLKLVSIELYQLEELKQLVEKYLVDKEEELVKNENLLNYFLSKIDLSNYLYLFRLVMQYDIEGSIGLSVKHFIKQNFKTILKDEEYRKLITENPGWSLKLLEYFVLFMDVS